MHSTNELPILSLGIEACKLCLGWSASSDSCTYCTCQIHRMTIAERTLKYSKENRKHRNDMWTLMLHFDQCLWHEYCGRHDK